MERQNVPAPDHFGGSKALLCYVNLQINIHIGGGETMQNFSFGEHCPVPPSGACLFHGKNSMEVASFYHDVCGS